MNEVKKTGAAPKAASFNVNKLSKEQKEAVVEEYIGIHPKYFNYRGLEIDIDVYKMAMDGTNWTGFPADHNKG